VARLETFGLTRVLRYTPGKVDWVAAGFPVEGERAARPSANDVLRQDVPRCRPDERLGDVRERVHRAGWTLAVAVDDVGVVLGLLRGAALDRDTDAVVESVMDPDPKTIRPSVALEDVGTSVLVTTPDGVLLGALKEAKQ
jgi:CBS domain-containing protein